VQIGTAIMNETMPPKLWNHDDKTGSGLLRHFAFKLKAPAISCYKRNNAIAVVPVPLQLNVIDARCEDAVDAAV
jgi:hypothetical protein